MFPFTLTPLAATRFSRRLRWVPLLLAFLAAGLDRTAAGAQEVAVFAHRGASDLVQLESTDGFGLAGRFPLLEWLDVMVSLSRRTGASAGVEEVCSQWQPRWQCYEEPVAYESDIEEAGFLLLPSLLETDHLRIAAGGGMSLNKFHSKGEGDSGRPVAVNMPSGAQRGFIGLVDVTLSPGRRSPWALVAAARIHRAELDGCVAQGVDLPVVEHFCGFYTFKEVNLGVALRF